MQDFSLGGTPVICEWKGWMWPMREGEVPPPAQSAEAKALKACLCRFLPL